MFIPFEKLPESSRVWIYTSERPLTPREKDFLANKLEEFTSNWQSHQKDVSSSFKIMEDRFVVIASDESTDVSGCGIDKSVHLIQEVEKELALSLMDKTIVYFKTGSDVRKANLKEIRSLIETNVLKPDTMFYNTLVANIKQLNNLFELPANEGWLKRYFALATPQ